MWKITRWGKNQHICTMCLFLVSIDSVGSSGSRFFIYFFVDFSILIPFQSAWYLTLFNSISQNRSLYLKILGMWYGSNAIRSDSIAFSTFALVFFNHFLEWILWLVHSKIIIFYPRHKLLFCTFFAE